MLRESDELRHRSQILVKIVELVCAGAGAGCKSAITIQRAIDATVVGEIHQVIARWQNHVSESVLVGMNVRERSQRIASVDMRQIYKWRTRACRIAGIDRAFI